MKDKILRRKWLLILVTPILLLGCAQFNEISIKGIKDVEFKGLNKKVIMLSFDVEIDNPNTRKISVVEIDFKAWLNGRELGTFKVVEPIRLVPCSKQTYSVPAEIELRTIADAFRIVSSGSLEGLMESIEVEGKVKGRSFPIRKTIKIPRQAIIEMSSSL
ncbi:MAG TPA: LEA type 2 family protein [Perlabentimonas sp.]|jgi:LEA14-like dessication related protein|nr:LEA type 2 family protein [Bacteroidales bacterium]MDD4671790.1 LEA type 2 family protein [Bacteroidales bacterium]MDY0347350.1 LEA type 2 family protein [Tenuifilaceae bacterium]HZJ74451.1 LEA type 2 family protein [Perlabentimonas sp.]